MTQKAREAISPAGYLKGLSARVKQSTRLAVAAGVFHTFATVIQLYLVAWLAEQVIVNEVVVARLYWPFFWLAIVTLLRVTMPVVQQWFASIAARQALDKASAGILGDWQALVKSGHTIRRADGALVSEPISALEGYIERFTVNRYLVVLSPLIILVVSVAVNPVVGTLLLLSGPIIPIFMVIVGMGAEQVSRKHSHEAYLLNRTFTDKVKNLLLLHLFDAQDIATKEVAEAGKRYKHANMAVLKIAFLSSAVLEFFSSVAIAAIALYVGFGLLGYISWLGADTLTLFSGLYLLLLAPEYFSPLRKFAQSYHDRAEALGAASLICNMSRNAGGQLIEGQQSVTTAFTDGTRTSRLIYWKALSAALPGGYFISFPDITLPCSSLTAVCGGSGSGKTTLLRIITGMQPYEGVLVRPGNYRHMFAYLAQEPFLPAGSLRNTINQFETHSDEAIIKGLSQIGMAALLSQLTFGLDTHLPEGQGLSGGEKRRIALLRCLLSNKPVIIADEPTENLDEQSAYIVRGCLASAANNGKLVIVATHDETLIAMADLTVRVDD